MKKSNSAVSYDIQESSFIDSHHDYLCKNCKEHSSRENIISAQVPAIVQKHSDVLFEYFVCGICRSITLNNQPDLAMFYSDYPLRQHQLDPLARTAYLRRLKRLRAQGLNESSSVLDYGCSTGLWIDFLIEQGFRNVQGYDPYIEKYRDKKTLQNTYDCVTCQDVIEHVEDPTSVARQLSSLVKTGGLLEIGTPRADAIDLRNEIDYRFEISAPYHLCILTEEELCKLFGDHHLLPLKIFRNFYYDTPAPFMNFRYIKEYFKACGSVMDAFFTFQWKALLNFKVIFAGLFGWISQLETNMTVIFQKKQ